MRRYANVHELADRAFCLREQIGGVRALDLRVVSGEFCRNDGAPSTLIVVGDRKRPGRWSWSEVCLRCKQPWDTVRQDRDILRGEVELHPRRGSAESHLTGLLDEFRTLEPVVFTKPRSVDSRIWRLWLTAWRAWLHPMLRAESETRGKSYATVAEYASRADTEDGEWWTEHRVRYGIERASTIVERRARRRPSLLHSRMAA